MQNFPEISSDNITLEFSNVKEETEIYFTEEQLKKLQNIKNMFRSAQTSVATHTEPEKKVVDHNFYKTLAYVATILFPILGSYLQHYLYVIYIYFKRLFNKNVEEDDD